ncbi:hypothetical protein AB6A40_006849 [Gnathostoma spinigerum]|uniref:Uncharacterized protein n=1 Tax=Gnathostoma spinigerum TaxID=75299 RepID=A0ABD6EKR2_9BILA
MDEENKTNKANDKEKDENSNGEPSGSNEPNCAKWTKFDEVVDESEHPIQAESSSPRILAELIADPAKLLGSNDTVKPSVSNANNVAEITVSQSTTANVPPHPPPVDPYARRTTTETEKFRNGKIVCAVYPENTTMAWIVPARFNPYSMPKCLTDERLQLAAEDYVTAMEMITNDYRFRCYCIFYGRLMAFWLSISIFVLIVVLLSQPDGGLSVLLFTMAWIFILFLGIFFVMIIRKQISIGLRHTVQSANKVLIKSDMLSGVEDRGQLSCHKIVILFMYIRTEECLPDIERIIRQRNAAAQPTPITMSNTEIRALATKLVLKYSQEFVKKTSQKRLLFPTRPAEGVSEFLPKHCALSHCLCQFIEKNHFNRSPKKWYERLF